MKSMNSSRQSLSALFSDFAYFSLENRKCVKKKHHPLLNLAEATGKVREISCCLINFNYGNKIKCVCCVREKEEKERRCGLIRHELLLRQKKGWTGMLGEEEEVRVGENEE